ncbi:hypothetical protein M1N14_00210 [Dehalococcoidia bacterium]|nr:hypothetical protein [Dehalococcoidia bacterium]
MGRFNKYPMIPTAVPQISPPHKPIRPNNNIFSLPVPPKEGPSIGITRVRYATANNVSILILNLVESNTTPKEGDIMEITNSMNDRLLSTENNLIEETNTTAVHTPIIPDANHILFM